MPYKHLIEHELKHHNGIPALSLVVELEDGIISGISFALRL